MIKVCDYADIYLVAQLISAKTKRASKKRSKRFPGKGSYLPTKHRRKCPDRPSLADGQPVVVHQRSRRYIGYLFYLKNDRCIIDSNKYGIAAVMFPTIYLRLYGKVNREGCIYLVDLSEVSPDRIVKVPHTRKGLRWIYEELKAAGYRMK